MVAQCIKERDEKQCEVKTYSNRVVLQLRKRDDAKHEKNRALVSRSRNWLAAAEARDLRAQCVCRCRFGSCLLAAETQGAFQ